MSTCIKCSKEKADFHFKVLSVQTLHIRDWNGERRVQAIGEFLDFYVCAACADYHLYSVLKLKKHFKKVIAFAAVLVIGILGIMFRSWPTEFRMPFYAAVICGAVGIFSTLHTALAQRNSFAALPFETALKQSAWECVLEKAPRKCGDNDVTYIPVNETTLSATTASLATEYDLLPANAKRAFEMLHGSSTVK